MTWVRIEDTFPEHPKIDKAGGDAGWLHVCALAYCNRNETDGFIATDRLSRLSDRRGPKVLAAKLVDAGLWEIDPEGWWIHDYLHYQPSRASLEQKRVDARERMAKARRSSPNVRANNDRTNDEHPPNKQRSSHNPDPTRPDPITYISDDDDSVDTPDQSSSFEAIITTTAKAIALRDRETPGQGFINGIAKNLRTERRADIDACITAGLTLYDSALRLGADPWFTKKALNGSHHE